jgi:hypothetical protein
MEVMAEMARAGQRAEAIALLHQIYPTMPLSDAERAVDKISRLGGAGGNVARPVAAAPARRTSSCASIGCVGVLVLVIGVAAAGFAVLPAGLTGALQQIIAPAAPSAVPTRAPNKTPTRSPLQVDATAGAKSVATQQAQVTRAVQAATTQEAQAMDTATAAEAAAATVADAATATAEALATAKTISTTTAAWPQLVADNFVDNRLGWPSGPSQDQYFSLNTSVAGKKYVWAVTPKQGAYANGFPASTTPITDFSATVKVKFAQGGQDGNAAFGLSFRHTSSEEYGFFGIDPAGHYRIQLSFGGIATEPITGTTSAIRTQAGQVNQLTVQAVGSDFVFLINNQVVAQTSADAPAGDVGVGVDANDTGKLVQVEFTDFSVHAPKQ